MTNEEAAAAVEHMSVQAVDTKPVEIDWREAAGEDYDGWSYWESFTYELDGERDITLIAQGPGGIVTHAYLNGALYGEDNWDEYENDHTDEDGELWPGALDEGEFEELFRVEPHHWGSEGPMMNYWYPIDESDSAYSRTFHPQEAAAKVRQLCVVEVDGNYGLALTGGGMDFSWEICEAFVALNLLPPTHFADLPRMAGKTLTDTNRLVLAALERALKWQQDNLGYRLERLQKMRADMEATS